MSGSRSRLGLSSRMGSHQDIHDSMASMGSTHNGLGLGLGQGQGLGGLTDLYYNSRPERSMSTWSYQPPPPVVTDQSSKPAGPQHFQPYERGYPKTLESLAEKVYAVCSPFYSAPFSVVSCRVRHLLLSRGAQRVPKARA